MILVEHSCNENENSAMNEIGKLSDSGSLGRKQVDKVLDKADGNSAYGTEGIRGDECRQVGNVKLDKRRYDGN